MGIWWVVAKSGRIEYAGGSGRGPEVVRISRISELQTEKGAGSGSGGGDVLEGGRFRAVWTSARLKYALINGSALIESHPFVIS